LNVDIRQIKPGSDDYAAMLALRDRVMRKPLGLRLTAEDTAADAESHMLGCFDGGRIKGCLILKKQQDGSVKLRQVAVDENTQGQGIGREMMAAAYGLAAGWGAREMFCHARETAVGFYEAQGWRVTSDMFLEQNIAHFRMAVTLPLEKTA
jgi:predicted GNAT family N-acyltransferase